MVEKEFQNLISQLESRNEFKEIKTQSPDIFLAHIFVMFDEENKNIYQIGFFDRLKQSMTTFIVKLNNSQIENIQIAQGDEILKVSDEIKKLEFKKVNFSSKQILETAENFKKEKYPSEPVSKAFFILQNLDDKQIFNFTFMTSSFKTLNIKIDSDDGNIVGFSLKNLMNILK